MNKYLLVFAFLLFSFQWGNAQCAGSTNETILTITSIDINPGCDGDPILAPDLEASIYINGTVFYYELSGSAVGNYPVGSPDGCNGTSTISLGTPGTGTNSVCITTAAWEEDGGCNGNCDAGEGSTCNDDADLFNITPEPHNFLGNSTGSSSIITSNNHCVDLTQTTGSIPMGCFTVNYSISCPEPPVTPVFSGCGCSNCPLFLPDGANEDFFVNVNDTGGDGNTTDDCSEPLTGISLNFDHEYIGDLEIIITSPCGNTATLVGPCCNNTAGGTWDLVFQDGAPVWDSNTTPFTGSFSPAVGTIAGLNCPDNCGTWTINVDDQLFFDDGNFLGFELAFDDSDGDNATELACDSNTPCDADAGTNDSTGPYILCDGDAVAWNSNDDYVLPASGCPGCLPALMHAVYDQQPPAMPDPGVDAGYTGIYWTGEDYNDSNVGGDSSYSPIVTVGANNTLWYVPITADDGAEVPDSGSLGHDQDGDGCFDTGTPIQVTYLNPIAGTVDATDAAACTWDVTISGGAVEFSTFLGTATEYTYDIVPPAGGTGVTGATTTGGGVVADPGGLIAGTYTVNVTNDGNGCTFSFPVNITNCCDPIAGTVTGNVIEDCEEDPNGTVNNGVSVNAATGNNTAYTTEYILTDGATIIDINTTGSFTNVAAGTYTIHSFNYNTTAGADGGLAVGSPFPGTGINSTNPACYDISAGVAVEIYENPTIDSITASDYNGFGVSCFGAADGDATANVSGGDGAYTYAWDNGQTTATATGLGAGTYNVTVTDGNGCISNTLSVTLTEPVAVTAAAVVDSDYNGEQISCVGAADGSATATGGGGVPGYTYAWNNGQTTATATGLSAGTYSVLVTDANGCTATTTVTLVDPPAVTATAAETASILCVGDANGEATVTAGGGVGGYTYLWDDAAAQTTATATGLAAGIYTVVVTDANGCTATAIVSLVDPPALTCAALVQDVSCPGDADGVITVDINGGTPDPASGGYEIFIDGVSIGFGGPGPVQIIDFPAGTYDVLIVDANGCECGGQAIVEEPLPLSVSCNANGLEGFQGNAFPFWYNTHQVTVSGGTGPYSVEMEREGYVRWDVTDNADGTSQVTINYADNAEWCVSIVDANGCTIDPTAFDCCNDDGTGAGEPSIPGADGEILDIDAVTIGGESGVNNDDGSIDLTLAGCAGGASYEWSGANGYTSTDAVATGLSSGLYYVTVTCDGETTTGWYWVPLDRNGGRLKVGDLESTAINAYPNPMVNQTTIEFAVKNSGPAEVLLFTIDGKFVSEIYNQVAETGNVYYVDLDGDQLAAGTYITVIVDAQGERAMNRIVVMK